MRFAISPVSAVAKRAEIADSDSGTTSIRFGDVLAFVAQTVGKMP